MTVIRNHSAPRLSPLLPFVSPSLSLLMSLIILIITQFNCFNYIRASLSQYTVEINRLHTDVVNWKLRRHKWNGGARWHFLRESIWELKTWYEELLSSEESIAHLSRNNHTCALCGQYIMRHLILVQSRLYNTVAFLWANQALTKRIDFVQTRTFNNM